MQEAPALSHRRAAFSPLPRAVQTASLSALSRKQLQQVAASISALAPRSPVGPRPGWGCAYHPEGPGGVVVLQRHLQPVVLGSVLVQSGAGLVHLLPCRGGNRLLGVVARGVIFLFFLILVVPLPGLLLICRDAHGSEQGQSPRFREPGHSHVPSLRPTRPKGRGSPRARGVDISCHRAPEATRMGRRTRQVQAARTRPRHLSPRSARSLLPMAPTAADCLPPAAAVAFSGDFDSPRKVSGDRTGSPASGLGASGDVAKPGCPTGWCSSPRPVTRAQTFLSLSLVRVCYDRQALF